MINACVQVHTSQGKCPIDDYSQQYLALLTLGSRLNARNALHCNHQLLKRNCLKQTKPRKFNIMKFFTHIVFNVKIPQSKFGHHNDITITWY